MSANTVSAAASDDIKTKPVRERLLDAAEGCLEQFGPQKTSMEDVARAAGMSRATVYRYFENRDALLLGVASRQASSLASDAINYLAQFNTISDWLVEGLLFTLRELPSRPVFASLVTSLDSRASGNLFLGSTGLVQIGVNVLRPMFANAKEQGLLRDDVDPEMLVEWLLRVLWTYLNAPSQVATDEEGMRKLFRMMLIPAVLKDSAV
ncbi:MAG: TetR/AcrR family transcriptional regulator [Myxococcales bacterium]|jgi:AcrR family transcriptional regulator|nr:TetR/AcrR family transcriptional regulator [Myxococcales bacterium]